MKSIIQKIFVGLALFSSLMFAIPSTSSAHELLPESVLNYIKVNPDASPQELENFIRSTSPELSKKIKNQQDVIEIAKQKTSFFDNAWDFIKLGVHHILSGPDHILFVLSLLLVFANIRNILEYTATFTVAHSFTLILAGSGLLSLSSRIVEPIIALSIAVVALTSVFLKDNKYFKDKRYKLGIIFFFGTFHGLGFAGLLEEIQVPEDKFLTSLLSFNLGIEVGQLIIVAASLPIIYLFRKKNWYPHAIRLSAVVIALVALTWTVERIIAQ